MDDPVLGRMTRKRLVTLAIVVVVAAEQASAFRKFFLSDPRKCRGRGQGYTSPSFGRERSRRVLPHRYLNISGVLVELRADVGDSVAKGAILARLDDREQKAQLNRENAAVEQAQANLQKATASVEKAEANYANAKSINERRQKLVQSSITPVETAETSKAVEDAARADVGLANSDVSVAKAAISDAKAQQEQQSVTLDFHILTAPYDAMVTTRSKELGSALAAGQPVFLLIVPKTIWVLAYVDESKAGEIKVGQPAEMCCVRNLLVRLRGRVARIQPESDRVNEERRIEVAFDQIPTNANLGEQAEVYITTMQLQQPLLVPEAQSSVSPRIMERSGPLKWAFATARGDARPPVAGWAL